MFVVLFQYYFHITPAYPVLASKLRAQGHVVWQATPDETGNLEWKDGEKIIVVQPGVEASNSKFHNPLFRCISRRADHIRFILRVRNYLKQIQPDIVQVDPSILDCIWLFPLFMPRNIHFIVDFRQVGQRSDPGLMAWLKNSLHNMERYLSCLFVFDRACFGHVAGAAKILGRKWSRWGSVIPCGIDDAFINFQRPSDCDQKVNGEPVQFIYIGTLSRVRRLELILASAKKALEKTGNFRITLMGADAADGYYHKMIEELQIASVVSIKPPVLYSKVPETISNYDVALAYLPDTPLDWHYAHSLKVLEYRALGLPIIASLNPPNKEIVEHGVNGLVARNTPEAFSKAMLPFIENPDFLVDCKHNALKMRQGILWSEIARQYEEVYLLLLKSKHFAKGKFISTE